MEKIRTREGVVAMLSNLLTVEEGARDRYENDVLIFEDEWFKKNLRAIKRDEDRHISMIRKLIEMMGG